jgi:hypothetical protein
MSANENFGTNSGKRVYETPRIAKKITGVIYIICRGLFFEYDEEFGPK